MPLSQSHFYGIKECQTSCLQQGFSKSKLKPKKAESMSREILSLLVQLTEKDDPKALFSEQASPTLVRKIKSLKWTNLQKIKNKPSMH